jgi:hypothetical protein
VQISPEHKRITFSAVIAKTLVSSSQLSRMAQPTYGSTLDDLQKKDTVGAEKGARSLSVYVSLNLLPE